jgi:hypothetical protein
MRHRSGACVWSADDADYADYDTKRMMTVSEDRRPAARQRRAGVRHDDVNTNPCRLWLVFTASYLTQTGCFAAGARTSRQQPPDPRIDNVLVCHSTNLNTASDSRRLVTIASRDHRPGQVRFAVLEAAPSAMRVSEMPSRRTSRVFDWIRVYPRYPRMIRCVCRRRARSLSTGTQCPALAGPRVVRLKADTTYK